MVIWFVIKYMRDPTYLLDESRHKICLGHSGEMKNRMMDQWRARQDAQMPGDHVRMMRWTPPLYRVHRTRPLHNCVVDAARPPNK